jgi:hypothetical protein
VSLVDAAAVDPHLGELLDLHNGLREATRGWARGEAPGPDVAAARRRALELNHQRYAERIPVYHDLAESVGLLAAAPLARVVDELLLLDVFKSYDPALVEARDFAGLTDWLGTVFTRRLSLDLTTVHTFAAWREALRRDGVYVSFSSATSGRLSFVPRDLVTMRALATNGATYTDERWRQREDGTLEPFDCLVAGPRGGGMGILDAGEGRARGAARAHFLVDEVLTVDAVQGGAARLPAAAAGAAYERAFAFLREAQAARRKALVFGAPFQVKRLAEWLLSGPGPLALEPGSIVVTGGGWKSFGGERLARPELLRLVREALGIGDDGCIDAYSTSELTATLRTCAHGGYHVPPLVEAVVLDEALTGRLGEGGHGALAFLDPFAVSYPGFVITGDEATLVSDGCLCGLHGPFLSGEIRRAQGLEIRGCGGVLESMAV